MAYLNKGSVHTYQGDVMLSTVTMIETAERRLVAKKQEVDDALNELDLLEHQAFDIYKKQIYYDGMRSGFIDATNDWIQMIDKGVDKDGNKIDKRKNYREKNLHKHFTDYLQKILGIDDIQIHHISDWNLGEGKFVYFMSHNHQWILEIPTIDGIRFKSYQKYGSFCFKLKLSHMDSKHTSSVIGYTFEEEDLKDIMAKGLKTYCSEEESDVNDKSNG